MAWGWFVQGFCFLFWKSWWRVLFSTSQAAWLQVRFASLPGAHPPGQVAPVREHAWAPSITLASDQGLFLSIYKNNGWCFDMLSFGPQPWLSSQSEAEPLGQMEREVRSGLVLFGTGLTKAGEIQAAAEQRSLSEIPACSLRLSLLEMLLITGEGDKCDNCPYSHFPHSQRAVYKNMYLP